MTLTCLRMITPLFASACAAALHEQDAVHDGVVFRVGIVFVLSDCRPFGSQAPCQLCLTSADLCEHGRHSGYVDAALRHCRVKPRYSFADAEPAF